MKVCFIGAVEFSKKALELLIGIQVEICGVISNINNKINADFSNLEPLCKKNYIDFFDTLNINSTETLEWIAERKPDVIFCFGWSQLIKKEILTLPKVGVVGFHPALLPANRGRHPIIWALVLGLDKTGSTFFFMDEGADSGDILSQRVIEVSKEDNAKTLYEKVTITALEQIKEFVPALQSGSFSIRKQNEIDANNWRKRGMLDGQIDFRMSSYAIYNLVRALSKPYVGAHVLHQNTVVSIWKVSQQEYAKKNIEPGKVLSVKSSKEILVKTHDGAILLEEHEFNTLPKVGDYL
ncbi:formyltransferase family protein [Thiomicrospira sp. R3]|uniref:formyltransferase family protein n=1 Tax=Thiomicrospira sp. R3 TaxID=3035472 RepID=UPI00259BAA50|nr:formyltransferase family protein [Thiomicrospira sp. R3]WFE67930.1 formyltransferase family protein [Thiomicrospira sp. R3]